MEKLFYGQPEVVAATSPVDVFEVGNGWGLARQQLYNDPCALAVARVENCAFLVRFENGPEIDWQAGEGWGWCFHDGGFVHTDMPEGGRYIYPAVDPLVLFAVRDGWDWEQFQYARMLQIICGISGMYEHGQSVFEELYPKLKFRKSLGNYQDLSNALVAATAGRMAHRRVTVLGDFCKTQLQCAGKGDKRPLEALVTTQGPVGYVANRLKDAIYAMMDVCNSLVGDSVDLQGRKLLPRSEEPTSALDFTKVDEELQRTINLL